MTTKRKTIRKTTPPVQTQAPKPLSALEPSCFATKRLDYITTV